MTNSFPSTLSFLKDYDLSGVSNVLQSTGNRDVLLLPARSEEQQENLLNLHLPSTFEGLLISPFKTTKEINHLQRTAQEISDLERELINFYYPIDYKVRYVGVTGTNGKTSVAWIFSEVLKAIGKKALYMGTPGVYLNGVKKDDTVLTTTPSYLDLRKLLHKYGKEINAVVLEVSSHALAQMRLKEIAFDSIAWTNLSQDHLDFHKSMEEYFEAKYKLCTLSRSNLIIPRQQNELRERLLVRGAKIQETVPYEDHLLEVPAEFERGFTRENLEVALNLAMALYPHKEKIKANKLTLPPGRIQKIEKKGVLFFVDYAHTPDALEKVSIQLKEIYPEKELITVFGCGGDRDKTKRPQMGAIAQKLSDKVIVTSDNPRTENPESIIDDIVSGMNGEVVLRESDRKKAIERAFEEAGSNTMILIAGKGHENYQEIGGVRSPFDDSEVVRNLL